MEKEVSKDVIGGDKFIPIFKYWLIIENFNLSGKPPVDRDLLQVCVKREMIKEALILRILMGFHCNHQSF
jgi:hypothetical protein